MVCFGDVTKWFVERSLDLGPEKSNDAYVEELKALLKKSPTRSRRQAEENLVNIKFHIWI